VIRVVVVDDQMLVRSGISGLLERTEDIRVVAEASDGAEAVGVIAHARPDVLLLDVRMPHCTGIELLQRQQGKLPPTILLTTFDDDDTLFDGMRAGAKGFLLKNISVERLAQAIRCVATGESLFGPAQTAQGGGPLPLQAAPPALLTSTEADILALLATGRNNSEIAAALGMVEGTIKNQVSSILFKLNVRDRLRAVLRGLELGYI
jgi:DNA-binding NarL/FixJ family response regulator